MRPLEIDWCAASETGLVRKENQDAHFEASAHGVFCVADGMGGGADGALASAWVCEEVRRAVEALAPAAGSEPKRRAVEGGVRAANRRIADYASRNGYDQMGSTAVVVTLDDTRRRGEVFNIGDSRVYRFHAGALEQLTRDHTMGAELEAALGRRGRSDGPRLSARSHPMAHVLTRAVGMTGGTDGDWKPFELAAGDWLLICSDGIHDMLEDMVIAAALALAKDAADALEALVKGVIAAGAADNYTMIVMKAVEA